MVIASPDAAAWVQLLRAAGYAVQEGSLATMTARSGGVVPGDTVLSASQISDLDHWVHSGGRIATSNPALLESLGVRYRKAALVSAATMKTMNGVAHWATPLRLLGLVAKNLTVLATSNKSGLGVGGTALMGSLPVGGGLVVAMAVDPVGGGREGFELLPRAAALVGTDLGAPIGPQLEGAEIFVDPGGLPKSLESDPAAVANLLAEAGARVAEIAAWDYDFSDRANDLNYER